LIQISKDLGFYDYRALKGHSSIYLPVIHFSLLVYSKPLAAYIKEKGFDLFAQNDYAFLMSIFEVLSVLFKYQPPFSID